jgi:dihydrolipoamide dehydrogenase
MKLFPDIVNTLTFEKDGKTQTVEGERILLSVGRRPVTEGFGLENLNVELEGNGIKVDEKCAPISPVFLLRVM